MAVGWCWLPYTNVAYSRIKWKTRCILIKRIWFVVLYENYTIVLFYFATTTRDTLACAGSRVYTDKSVLRHCCLDERTTSCADSSLSIEPPPPLSSPHLERSDSQTSQAKVGGVDRASTRRIFIQPCLHTNNLWQYPSVVNPLLMHLNHGYLPLYALWYYPVYM